MMEYLQTILSSSLRGRNLEGLMTDFFDHIDEDGDNSISRNELYTVAGTFVKQNSLGLYADTWPSSFGGWFVLYWKFNIGFQIFLYLVEHFRFFTGLRKTWKWRETGGYKELPTPAKGTIAQALHYDTPWPGWFSYEGFKTIFMTVTFIAPFRIIAFISFLMLGFVFCGISTMGKKDGLWYRFFMWAASMQGYNIAHVLGYYVINQTGEFDRSAKIIVSNHICLCETILIFALAGGVSPLSRIENMGVPLFPVFAEATGTILVDRETPESRAKGLQDIHDRAKSTDPSDFQLMIFPEGTFDNSNCLFRFNKGAFAPGAPVQPILFNFMYRHYNLSWTGEAVGGNNVYVFFYRMACQFVNRCEVHVMPKYEPSKAEQADPVLYANNVQKVMAHQLNVPVTDATFADYKEAQAIFDAKQTTKKGGKAD